MPKKHKHRKEKSKRKSKSKKRERNRKRHDSSSSSSSSSSAIHHPPPKTKKKEPSKSHKRKHSKRASSSSSSTDLSSLLSPPRNNKKKSQREVEPNEDGGSVPLNCLLHKRGLLARIAVNCIDPDKLETLLPFCLIDCSKEDLIKQVAEELEGMSKKRILAALEGKEASSSNESEEDVSEQVTKNQNETNDSPGTDSHKTFCSDDRVSLTREISSDPQCTLEEGEIVDEV